MIFGVSKAISREHTAIAECEALVLDISDVPHLGVTSSLAIENAIQDALDMGRQVFIVGASGQAKRRLEKLGVLAAIPPQNLLGDRQEALRQAIAQVKGQAPVKDDYEDNDSAGADSLSVAQG
jgi:SulP family sulfate permease